MNDNDTKWIKFSNFVISHIGFVQFIISLISLIFPILCTILGLFYDMSPTILAQILIILLGLASETLTLIVLLDNLRRNSASKEDIFNIKTNSSHLTKRSPNTIQDSIINKNPKEIYITGISNNSILHLLYNDPELIKTWILKNITINLLFLQCEDTDNFIWYEKMRAGLSDNQKTELLYRKDRTISEYNNAVRMLNNEERFIEMQQNGKLIIRVINSPMSTAFFACDINNTSSDTFIQCSFYIYGYESNLCPTYTLTPMDTMYDTAKDALNKMWNNSTRSKDFPLSQ